MGVNNTANCTCTSFYTGQNCEISSGCSKLTCANGAVCVDNTNTGGTYACECKANYYGDTCQFHVTAAACQSNDTDSASCSEWKRRGLCSFSYTINETPIPVYCPYSCQLCSSVSSCKDNQASCVVWSSRGLCPLINSKDPNLCKKSCGSCSGLSNTLN